MKKSLIALAVAGAFVAPAVVWADAKIGGEIDVTLESFNNGSKSGLMLNNTHTRWWMDNADDIGGGNKVLAHFEMDQAASSGGVGNNPATGINNRNSFIGIQGGFGLIKLGTEEGIYEQLGYQVDAYHGAAGPAGNIVNGLGTYGATSTAVGLGTGGNANHICGAENLGCRREGGTISYVSPDINGLNFKVDYSVKGPSGAAPNDNNGSVLQAGGYWAGNAGGTGVRVGLGTIQAKNVGLIGTAGQSETDTGMRFTIGATFGDFMIDALLEQNKWKNDAAAKEIKANHVWLQGVYNLPTGKVIVDVMKLGKTKLNGGDLADTDGKHFGVGYYHNLSKASALYVIYSKIDNKDQANFGMQEGGAASVGKDPSAIGVGLYTTF